MARVGGSECLHSTRTNLNQRIFGSYELGGPILTVDRTIFEMWLGSL